MRLYRFLTAVDDASFNDVYDATGTELKVSVGGASRFIALDPTYFVGLMNIKIRSGTSAAGSLVSSMTTGKINATPLAMPSARCAASSHSMRK